MKKICDEQKGRLHTPDDIAQRNRSYGHVLSPRRTMTLKSRHIGNKVKRGPRRKRPTSD